MHSKPVRLETAPGGEIFLFTSSRLIDGKIWLGVYYMLLSQPLSTAEICKVSR